MSLRFVRSFGKHSGRRLLRAAITQQERRNYTYLGETVLQKRDVISDRAIVPAIVRSCLCDDRFALFLPRSRILCNRIVRNRASACNALRSYEFL